MFRECTKCKVQKELPEFYLLAQGRGLQARCKTCYLELQRVHQQDEGVTEQRKIRGRKAHLKRRYNLTPEQVRDMLEVADNKCAICAAALVRPVVDHDHATGRVRALPCHSCNVGLGMFRDDPGTMRAAAAYIERFSV